MITIAIPKGRMQEESLNLFVKVGIIPKEFVEEIENNDRKLIWEYNGLRILLVKPKDVGIYVEEGIADIGIVGKDLLIEYLYDVFELMDLGIGYCKVVVAGKEKGEDLYSRIEKEYGYVAIATKYPRITKSFFDYKEIPVKIIELYGSIELAPITGLSHFIVDLVSTGRTLKENGLEIIEDIIESTGILISNKVSYYKKFLEIEGFIKKIEMGVANGSLL